MGADRAGLQSQVSLGALAAAGVSVRGLARAIIGSQKVIPTPDFRISLGGRTHRNV